jgi:actin-related protein 5
VCPSFLGHTHAYWILVTSELMFEMYSVPSLTYAVDAVLSFYHNNLPTPPSSSPASSGLAISFNTSSTSVIPILKGKGIMSQAKRCGFSLLRCSTCWADRNLCRIPWGSQQASEYLLKLIQLKYPTFTTRITPAHTNVRAFLFFTLSLAHQRAGVVDAALLL